MSRYNEDVLKARARAIELKVELDQARTEIQHLKREIAARWDFPIDDTSLDIRDKFAARVLPAFAEDFSADAAARAAYEYADAMLEERQKGRR